LWNEVLKQNAEGVREALRHGGVATSRHRGSRDTPLHWVKNDAETAEVLLEGGAEVNARNNEGNTPLHEAATFGFLETIKVLLEWGADVDAVNNGGYTPINFAELNSRPDTVKFLQVYKEELGNFFKYGS